MKETSCLLDAESILRKSTPFHDIGDTFQHNDSNKNKTIAFVMINGEEPKAFPLSPATRQRMSILSSWVQYSA